MRRRSWRFADFEFGSERGLERMGNSVPLQPKPRGLLELLLRAGGAVVPKETIAAALWTDDAPSDNSLARAVRSLRRALGADGSEIVRTIYGEGVRISCPVETERAEDEHDHSVGASLVRAAWEISGARTPGAIARVIETLRFAVARFPDYAPAWTLMADTVAAQAISGGVTANSAATRIAEYSRKALIADPQSGCALAASGWALGILSGRPDEGLERVNESIRTKPEWQGFFYRAWLRVDRRDLGGALADVEAGLMLSPLERALLGLRAWLTVCQGKLDRADALAREGLNVREDDELLWAVRAAVACERGDPARGVAFAERACALTGASRIALSHLACACAKAGDFDRARSTIAAIKARSNGLEASFIAAPLLALGETAEAECAFRQAYQENSPGRVFGWCNPRLKALSGGAPRPAAKRAPVHLSSAGEPPSEVR